MISLKVSRYIFSHLETNLIHRTLTHRTLIHRTLIHRTLIHRTLIHRTLIHRTLIHRTLIHKLFSTCLNYISNSSSNNMTESKKVSSCFVGAYERSDMEKNGLEENLHNPNADGWAPKGQLRSAQVCLNR
jgi:hypothetical protein